MTYAAQDTHCNSVFRPLFDAINLTLYPLVPVTFIVAIDIIIYVGFHLGLDRIMKKKRITLLPCVILLAFTMLCYDLLSEG